MKNNKQNNLISSHDASLDSASLVEFKQKLKYYLHATGKNQNDLVEYPDRRFPARKNLKNPHPLYIGADTLSHKLSGTKGCTITPDDAETIVKALAYWNAFEYKDQLIDLLKLRGHIKVDLSSYNWKLPYIEKLKDGSTSLNTTSDFFDASSDRIADTNTDTSVHTSIGSSPNQGLNPPFYSKTPENNRITHNWYDTPSVKTFYGRETELTLLSNLIIGSSDVVNRGDRQTFQVISILGIGGIGKTTLCAKFVEQVGAKFNYVFWQSLRNAPSPETVLVECWRFLTGEAGKNERGGKQNETPFPSTLDQQISWLIRYMQNYRCLLILDNLEAVLQKDNSDGQYQKGYEGYGQLLRQAAETAHRSCIILTSREKPKGFSRLESSGHDRAISIKISGLDFISIEKLLKHKNLVGTSSEMNDLVSHYSGNPLALLLVSDSIATIFNGNISRFLAEKTLFFSDVKDLLDQQFDNILELERVIIYWLALAREPLSLDKLANYIQVAACVSFLDGISTSKASILGAIKTLQRRALIETVSSLDNIISSDVESSGSEEGGESNFLMPSDTDTSFEGNIKIGDSEKQQGELSESRDTTFTLQNVIMEYVTFLTISQVVSEIKSGNLEVLCSHALLLTDQKVYARESQLRIILDPIIAELNMYYHRSVSTENRLMQLLRDLRKKSTFEQPQQQGYAGGNLLNLLCRITVNSGKGSKPITKLDLSGLNIWHAYLVGQHLNDVNISDCDLSNSVFTETFDGVMTLTFSPDERYLAMGSVNGQVRVWQVSDYKHVVFNTVAHKKTIRSVIFDTSGALLATASDDGEVKLWDLSANNTGSCLKIFKAHTNRIWGLAFSPDSNKIVSAGEDNILKLWDVTTGLCLKTFEGHTNWVRTVAFSPNGKTIASGSGDCTVRLWDLESGKCLYVLKGHNDKVRSVAFSPNGKTIASGSEDCTLRLWDSKTGKCIRTFEGHTGRVRSIAYGLVAKRSNTDPEWVLISGGDDQSVRVWETKTGKCLQVFRQGEGWIWTVALSATGKFIATGGEDQIIKLLELKTGRTLLNLQGYSTWLGAVAVSSDGRWLASGGEGMVVELWDIGNIKTEVENKEKGKYPSRFLRGHTNRLRAIAFSPDGQLLASGGEDHTVRLWEVASGKCLHIFSQHTGRIRTIAFSPDGQLLASGGEDQTIKIWDLATKTCLHTLSLETDWIATIAFSQDGCLLASNGEGQSISLWDITSGMTVASWSGHTDRIRAVAFSPDGLLLATGSVDSTARIWSVRTGECLQILSHHTDRIRAVAFNPMNGEILATCSEDATIMLWDIRTGKLLHTLAGHLDRVWSITFSPDGVNLFSASEDGTIKLWEASTGKCMRTFQSERPYERLDITGVSGLTANQKAALKTLGAVESHLS